MAKTFQEEATKLGEAIDDFFSEVVKALRLRDLMKWLDDKLKRLIN